MNSSTHTNKEYIQDGLIILILIAIGFIMGQLINLSIVKIFKPDFFDILSEIKKGEITDADSYIYLLKIMQFTGSVFTFVLPPLLIVKFYYNKFGSLLDFKKSPRPTYYFFTILFLLSIMPAMNIIINWNEAIELPDQLSRFKDSLIQSEKAAKRTTLLILSGGTYYDFLLNLLIVAVVPAIGEELLFRGVLQKFLSDWLKNPHVAILISAFLFSAIHFQFFGLVPRFVLGAIFGYLVYYSGSLWPAIWAHFFNNAIAITAMFYVSKKGVSDKIESIDTSTPGYWVVISGLVIAFFIGRYLFTHKRLQF